MVIIVLTIIAAVILLVIAMVCLSISKLLTGKSRLRRGGCKMAPPSKDSKKKSSCSLCGPDLSCKQKEEEKEE